jgi:hypothetical protein
VTETFADKYHAYHLALSNFEDNLFYIQEFDYDRISCDDYDGSIEFYGVPNDVRLSEEAQRFLSGEGFIKCWLNHQDGWETSHSLGSNFTSKGWRKRQWKRKLDDGKRDPSGLIDVEEFPDSWPNEWLESGYVTVIGR